jgi:hypothetical protein
VSGIAVGVCALPNRPGFDAMIAEIREAADLGLAASAGAGSSIAPKISAGAE